MRAHFATTPLTFPALRGFFFCAHEDDCGMPFRCPDGLPFSKNEEPNLDQLLAEPMVRLLMARDRVQEAELRRHAAEIRALRLKRLKADPS